MSNPININSNEQSQALLITVKAPNGTLSQVTVYDSYEHPATIAHLASAVENQYATIFPNWDPIAYPCTVYTDGWAVLDMSGPVDQTQTYGVCPQDSGMLQQSDDGTQFDMDP